MDESQPETQENTEEAAGEEGKTMATPTESLQHATQTSPTRGTASTRMVSIASFRRSRGEDLDGPCGLDALPKLNYASPGAFGRLPKSVLDTFRGSGGRGLSVMSRKLRSLVAEQLGLPSFALAIIADRGRAEEERVREQIDNVVEGVLERELAFLAGEEGDWAEKLAADEHVLISREYGLSIRELSATGMFAGSDAIYGQYHLPWRRAGSKSSKRVTLSKLLAVFPPEVWESARNGRAMVYLFGSVGRRWGNRRFELCDMLPAVRELASQHCDVAEAAESKLDAFSMCATVALMGNRNPSFGVGKCTTMGWKDAEDVAEDLVGTAFSSVEADSAFCPSRIFAVLRWHEVLSSESGGVDPDLLTSFASQPSDVGGMDMSRFVVQRFLDGTCLCRRLQSLEDICWMLRAIEMTFSKPWAAQLWHRCLDLDADGYLSRRDVTTAHTLILRDVRPDLTDAQTAAAASALSKFVHNLVPSTSSFGISPRDIMKSRVEPVKLFNLIFRPHLQRKRPFLDGVEDEAMPSRDTPALEN